MSAVPRYPVDTGYHGLKMDADEYLALGETQGRYELIDGVVVMSPSPVPRHSKAALRVIQQLMAFGDRTGSIEVFAEIDVCFTSGTVYRPDVCAYRADRLPRNVHRLDTPPDLIVEVLSGGTKLLDLITKRDDYERFGVAEYWAVDPATGRVRAWRRQGVRLLEAPVEGDTLACAALPGFVFDLRPIRALAGDGTEQDGRDR